MSCRTICFHCTMLVAVAACCAQAQEPSDQSDAESHFTQLKAKLEFVLYDSILYNREPRGLANSLELKLAWENLKRVRTNDWEVPDLVRLSKSDDPHVRTLALLSLVAKESQAVIPVCIRLKNDSAETLPDIEMHSISDFRGKPSLTQPRKVGDIAIAVLRRLSADFKYENDRSISLVPSDESWWNARKDNPDWLAWYNYLYSRATGSTSFPQSNRVADLQRLRKSIDSLPELTRSWILLHLPAGPIGSKGAAHYSFITVEDKIAEARFIGADRLLEFLRTGKRNGIHNPDDVVNSDSPNMSRETSIREERQFLETYAASIFDEQQAGTLLELEFFQGAVEANKQLLHRAVDLALQRYNRQNDSSSGRIMAMLACVGNDDDIATAVNWFYKQPRQVPESGTDRQGLFIQDLYARIPSNWEGIVRGLVAHDGFEDLDPRHVGQIARLIAKQSDQKLSTDNWNYHEDSESMRDALRERFNLPAFDLLPLTETERLDGPVWRTELEGRFSSFGQSFVLSPDGSTLSVALKSNNETVWSLRTSDGTVLSSIDSPHENTNLAFSSAGAPVSATDQHVWTAPQGVAVLKIEDKTMSWTDNATKKVVWSIPCRWQFGSELVISPSGKLIAANNGFENAIDLIESETGKTLFRLFGHSSVPRRLSFCADSTKLISLGKDSRVILWDLTTGIPLQKFRSQKIYLSALAILPDGRSFAVQGSNGWLTTYSAVDGRAQFTIKSNRFRPQAVIASTDGKYLYLVTQHSMQSPCVVECWELPK